MSNADDDAGDDASNASMEAALSWLAESAATLTELQIELSEIAAPTGNEHARARGRGALVEDGGVRGPSGLGRKRAGASSGARREAGARAVGAFRQCV